MKWAYSINEPSSFTASTGAGVGAVKVGLYFLAVATPGWVGLIVGTAIVGTAAVVSTEMNSVVEVLRYILYSQYFRPSPIFFQLLSVVTPVA